MKNDIHPKNYEVSAHCACGNRFSTNSTATDLTVPICSNCHPFYTGASRFLDTAGRIEKFSKKYAKVNEAAAAKSAVKADNEVAADVKAASGKKAGKKNKA